MNISNVPALFVYLGWSSGTIIAYVLGVIVGHLFRKRVLQQQMLERMLREKGYLQSSIELEERYQAAKKLWDKKYKDEGKWK